MFFNRILQIYLKLKNYYLFKLLGNGIILDVGCGEELRGHIGCDLNLPKKKTKFFVRCDAHNLPFKNKVFDVAFESGVLAYCKDKNRVLGEMQRVGKRVLVSEPLRTFLPHRKERKHWLQLKELLKIGRVRGFIGIPFFSGTCIVEVNINRIKVAYKTGSNR